MEPSLLSLKEHGKENGTAVLMEKMLDEMMVTLMAKAMK
jgi:hypothetical protein